MTITFNNGATIEALSATIDQNSLCILPKEGNPGLYELFNVRSIIPDMSIPYKDRPKSPTALQTDFTNYLQNQGYVWDRKHSTAAAGIVIKRADGDFWFFGLDGEIMHHPEALLSIDTKGRTYNRNPDNWLLTLQLQTMSQAKTKWVRFRFHANPQDCRPVIFNEHYPYWKTGESGDGTYVTVVAYLPEGTNLYDYWPEATTVGAEKDSEIIFTSRFPKPNWYIPLPE